MAESTVSWEGLEKLILDMDEKIPAKSQSALNALTQDTFETTLLRYVENLSGGAPSTAASPLPVGVRSGNLLAHAWSDSRMINQYAFEIANNAEYAGWIELGTEKMAARHPLQDAVDQLEDEMDVRLDEVEREIFE